MSMSFSLNMLATCILSIKRKIICIVYYNPSITIMRINT